MTENRRRVSHLGDAVRHLDKKCVELTDQANALRKEQITEEIEVLLLSTGLTRKGASASASTSPPYFGVEPQEST
jgi:hypothetical protein